MDLVRGSVYVVESKGHKDRVVAVADDLLQIMRSYSTLISEIYPDSDYFFSEIRWGWAVYEALDRRNVLEMLQYGRNYCV